MLALAAVLILTGVSSPAVQAGPTWVFFTMGLNGKTAVVAENITYNPLNAQYYYTFAVDNTTIGGAKVDGFFIGVGNQAAALAGGQSFGAGAAGGADAPFPAGFGAGGASPILSGVFIAGVPLNPAGTPWGFEEFDGVNSYVMRWYDSAQGANGPSDLPVGGFTGLFQLVSPFGPVPGYGGVDPFSGTYMGFEDSAGIFTLTETPNSYPTGDINSGTPPNIFQPLSIPEPSSVILLASGCIGCGALVLVRRSRRRPAA